MRRWIGIAGVCVALAAPAGFAMTRTEYDAAKDRADSRYKAADAQCAKLAGNPKDVCRAEAKAERTKAKAQAEADYKNTPDARKDAAVSIADAEYDVAKERCDAKTGNEKDVCVQQAKADHTHAVADAKARDKSATAERDAAADKNDADYKVAMEKCDAFSGRTKSDCQKDAKGRYDK